MFLCQDYNLYLMNEKNCCDSRKHLVMLGEQIFRDKTCQQLREMSNEQFWKQGGRYISKMRIQESLAKQTLNVLKQIIKQNSVEKVDNSINMVLESPQVETIRKIINLKIAFLNAAKNFKDIIQGDETQIKPKLIGTISGIFKQAKIQSNKLKSISGLVPSITKTLTNPGFQIDLNKQIEKNKVNELQKQKESLLKTLEMERKKQNVLEIQIREFKVQLKAIQTAQIIQPANQDFDNDYFEDISGINKSKRLNLTKLESMSMIPSLPQLEQYRQILPASKEKQLADKEVFTINCEYIDDQSQTNKQEKKQDQAQTQQFEELIAGQLRSLEEKNKQKNEYTRLQAEKWKNEYLNTVESLKNAERQLENMGKMLRIKLLFQGSVFQDNEREKQVLIRHIEEKGGYTIESTRLLYRFDPLNKRNFHQYIDNIEGIALIIKSKAGFFFGGFYEGKIEPDKVLNQFGILVSISNDTSYMMIAPEKNKAPRAVLYDPFYFIFGNAEIRLKSGEDFVFTNFGIMNSYYSHNSKKSVDFVGEANKEVKFETYQFYHVKVGRGF